MTVHPIIGIQKLQSGIAESLVNNRNISIAKNILSGVSFFLKFTFFFHEFLGYIREDIGMW